ncbi:MAG: class I SAM-dependent methyltransferase [Ruminococcus sp.]|nr:class I SAM-dependent methyltransferase [Ruminococcus sp.]
MTGSDSRLDNRLMLCADFVRDGAKLADIGTDHAYLPVWLCRIGKCPQAIAADINEEPLKRGRTTIINADLCDKVSTRLSDGLKEIRSDEADDIVIAGMGGELIAKILTECNFAKDSSKHFILQPMTKSEFLIKWLCENGYTILRQDCCIASKKCYTVLLVQYTGEIIARDEIYYYLAELSPNTDETHLRFVESHINRLLKQAKGDVRFAMLAEKLQEIINDKN